MPDNALFSRRRGKPSPGRYRKRAIGLPFCEILLSGPERARFALRPERHRRSAMGKFVISPHFRLQEWVAEEKGYFAAENLDYEFRELIRSTEGQHHNKVNEGAFQSIEQGRKADVSCACHWTVNV